MGNGSLEVRPRKELDLSHNKGKVKIFAAGEGWERRLGEGESFEKEDKMVKDHFVYCATFYKELCLLQLNLL